MIVNTHSPKRGNSKLLVIHPAVLDEEQFGGESRGTVGNGDEHIRYLLIA